MCDLILCTPLRFRHVGTCPLHAERLREGAAIAACLRLHVPNMRGGHSWLAATCAQMGKLEEARAAVAEVMRIEPNYTIGSTSRGMMSFKMLRTIATSLMGKAGLPE